MLSDEIDLALNDHLQNCCSYFCVSTAQSFPEGKGPYAKLTCA